MVDIQSDGFSGIPAISAISGSRDLAKLDFSIDARICRALDPARLQDIGSAPASTRARNAAGSLTPRVANSVVTVSPSGNLTLKSNPDSARRRTKS